MRKYLVGVLVMLASTVAYQPGAMAGETRLAAFNQPHDQSYGTTVVLSAAPRAGVAESASITRAAFEVDVPVADAGYSFAGSEVQAAVQAGVAAALNAQAASVASAALAESQAEETATREVHHGTKKDALILSPFIFLAGISALSW